MAKVGEIIVKLGADNRDLERGLRRARTETEKTMEAINSIANKMAIFGGAATAALAGAVKAAMDWSESVNAIEDKTGMAAEAASKWLYTAQYFGLEADTLTKAFDRMSKNVMTAAQQQELAAASGREATDIFTRFGIAIKDAEGNLLSHDQILQNIHKRHLQLNDGIENTSMELEIFGRTGADLNDMLNATPEKMARLHDQAKKLHKVSHDMTQTWENLTFETNQVKLAAGGLAVQLGNDLQPTIKSLVESVSETIEKFQGLSDETRSCINHTLALIAAVGGLGAAFRALNFMFGPIVGGLKSIVTALNQVRLAALTAKGAVYGLLGLLAAGALYRGFSDYHAFQEGGLAAIVDEDTEHYMKEMQSRIAGPGTWDALPNQPPEPKQEEEAGGFQDIPADLGNRGTFAPGSSGGGGSDNAAAKAKELARKVEEIHKSIAGAAEESQKLARDFGLAGEAIDRAGLEGAEKVMADITAKYENQIRRNDEWLEKYRRAVEEAEEIKAKAIETGDEKAIAAAEASLKQRQDEEVEAAKEINRRRLELEEQLQRELTKRRTTIAAIEADMQKALDEGNMSAYIAAAEERLAIDADEIAQRQELLEQFYEWRQEAELTRQEQMLNSLNMLKDGLAESLTGAIMGTQNLDEALKNLAKNIIATYIQQRIQAKLSGALSSALQKKAMAEQLVQDRVRTASALKLAHAQALATAGANIVMGEAAFSSALARVAVPKFAAGGVVTAPTLGLVGEVPHRKEGVFPLTDEVFGKFAEGIAEQGGSAPLVLNVSALDAGSFMDFLRRGGGRELKQHLADINREFTATADVW